MENVGVGDIPNRAAEESKAQYGHDLFSFYGLTPTYEDEVIDHRELYEECERQYGTAYDLALKTTYNPKTKKFWGFADYYVVMLTNYRKDLWDAVGTVPDTWENVRQGGRKIKLLHEKPLGIGLGGDLDCEAAIRAMLYSFGASEQDTDNRPALKSPAALEVLICQGALRGDHAQRSADLGSIVQQPSDAGRGWVPGLECDFHYPHGGKYQTPDRRADLAGAKPPGTSAASCAGECHPDLYHLEVR